MNTNTPNTFTFNAIPAPSSLLDGFNLNLGYGILTARLGLPTTVLINNTNYITTTIFNILS